MAWEMIRGLRVALAIVDPHLHLVGGQHLQGGSKGRFRERVGVDAEEQRPVDPLPPPVFTEGLGDGQDVVLVEGAVEGGAAVARGAAVKKSMAASTSQWALRKVFHDVFLRLSGAGSMHLAASRRRWSSAKRIRRPPSRSRRMRFSSIRRGARWRASRSVSGYLASAESKSRKLSPIEMFARTLFFPPLNSKWQ